MERNLFKSIPELISLTRNSESQVLCKIVKSAKDNVKNSENKSEPSTNN